MILPLFSTCEKLTSNQQRHSNLCGCLWRLSPAVCHKVICCLWLSSRLSMVSTSRLFPGLGLGFWFWITRIASRIPASLIFLGLATCHPLPLHQTPSSGPRTHHTRFIRLRGMNSFYELWAVCILGSVCHILMCTEFLCLCSIYAPHRQLGARTHTMLKTRMWLTGYHSIIHTSEVHVTHISHEDT